MHWCFNHHCSCRPTSNIQHRRVSDTSIQQMIHRTPFFLPLLFPSLVWRIPTKEKVLFLTFDDGPVPGPTEFALHTLCRFSARATFFCIGDNIRKYPGVFRKVVEDGHAIGNHTFNHLSGWRTGVEEYVGNVRRCEEEVVERSREWEARSQEPGVRRGEQGVGSKEQGARSEEQEISVKESSTENSGGIVHYPSPKPQGPKLFRPPYGRITKRQIRELKDYQIIMWDVLTMDYNKNLSEETCLRNTIQVCRPGSIVVLHDSYKAERNMTYVLPRLLEHFAGQGFAFKALPG